jgi:hypothetical protein
MNSQSSFTREDLVQIARSQTAIISLILVNVFFGICFGIAVPLIMEGPGTKPGPLISWIAQGAMLVLNIIAAVYIYRLAKALHKTAWVYALAAFFPCVGLITLLLINHFATRALRRHGVRVGLTGAVKSDLDHIAPAPDTPPPI